jgi:ABC-2 type transport system permease protein
MAVYERAYRGYDGPHTPERTRFLILPRYALRDVFRSRIFTGFFALCFVGPLVFSVLIYLHHNLAALKAFQAGIQDLVPIDAKFFLVYLVVQGSVLAFFMTLIVGPALVSPDLRNNALPLYLARPFSRTEYVLGKSVVLAGLLSMITWIPGLFLFALQSYLEGPRWMWANARIGIALVVGSWVWIVLLALLALAVSATVKWKPVAAATLLILFMVAAAAGAAFNATFGTTLGNVISIGSMIQRVWEGLFGVEPEQAFPLPLAWMSLAATCAVSLWLLARKLRAYEVVR